MRQRLEGLLQQALTRVREGGALKLESLPPLIFEIPRDQSYGDLASTVALGLARSEGRKPRDIAQIILDHMVDPEGLLAAAEIAGPGYINFRFGANFWRRCLIDLERDRCGVPAFGERRRVLVEFVSANPTGPLHVGHGRGAVLGDAVSRLLSVVGYDVTREYYINDAGKQIEMLAASALARLQQAWGADCAIPEDGYPGEYLIELMQAHRDVVTARFAGEVGQSAPGDRDAALSLFAAHAETARRVCGEFAAERLLAGIVDDMRALAVEMDLFVSERDLRARGVVDQALLELESAGYLYASEGARWFRSTEFGDEKDRVIVRSDGELTYFAADIGYHREKLGRGFADLIDVWGADHHGYVARVAAALRALGADADLFHVLLVQLVRLTRGGEPVRMGKRSGEFVTLREVVDEVGRDATRFFFLMRKGDSQLEFDLDLAVKQSSENPVFYVQYAHARCCSIFRQAEKEGITVPDGESAALSRLTAPTELELIKMLAMYTDTVAEAAREREPHRVVFYLIDTASSFHRFYNQERVMTDDRELSEARLYLVRSAQRVLRHGLELVGVGAPEGM
jgi:arginyl-tRNA synthetase